MGSRQDGSDSRLPDRKRKTIAELGDGLFLSWPAFAGFRCHLAHQ
jgi:hypothetical protein